MELDRIAEEYIKGRGAVPAFKGYNGFPGNICSSVNEEVVHGIPGLRKLKNGDNVSIDIGAVINGYNGDAAITVAVGEIDAEVQKLLDVTEESLYKGIERRLSVIVLAIFPMLYRVIAKVLVLVWYVIMLGMALDGICMKIPNTQLWQPWPWPTIKIWYDPGNRADGQSGHI